MWPWWCVGWYDTVILSCLVSNVHFNCIVQDSLYHDMDIGILLHGALASCTPSKLIGLVLGSALFWCWVSLCAPFTMSLTECYFSMIFIIIIMTISGTLCPFFSFWTFHPLTFSLNVGLNMLPSDYFMSCLHSALGYSTMEFQALQLIVLVGFGAVD